MVNRISPIVRLTAGDWLLLLTVATVLFGCLMARGAANDAAALVQCLTLGERVLMLPFTPRGTGAAPLRVVGSQAEPPRGPAVELGPSPEPAG